MPEQVVIDRSHKPVLVITINRPERRNAVDRETAHKLYEAFLAFDADLELMSVAILTGAGGNFCAGADLKSMLGTDGKAEVTPNSWSTEDMTGEGPMGPTRMLLRKPVIAAISGYAVAGGLELINLPFWEYIAECEACHSPTYLIEGVPLVDGGTIRLPRLIGLSRAMDIILTGRDVPAKECLEIGLANYMAPPGTTAVSKALEVAKQLCSHPQRNMRNDRLSVLSNYDWQKLLKTEMQYGLDTLRHPLPQVSKFNSKL